MLLVSLIMSIRGRKMNRTISGILVVTLFLVLAGIAGCGGTASPSTTQTAGAQTNNRSTSTISDVKDEITTSATNSSPNQGNTDIWADIPVYPNSQLAQDEGFGQSIGGDPSFSQIEWRFFTSTDDTTKVSNYYKAQMTAKGWTKDMWADSEELAYGSFHKSNDTRMSLVYVVKGEGTTSMNIMSAAK
jgi:hypothetical protein